MATWRKLGHVYAPDGKRAWARSHALLPTALALPDGRVRVYYAACDEQMYGRPGYVDVDPADPTRVLYDTPEPVLDLGELGTFDDCGVTPSCALRLGDGTVYLYYVGWQRAQRVPYMLFTGLAVSRDGGATFTRHARVPVIDRSAAEPLSRGAPYVEQTAEGFTAYYWSCFKWATTGGRVHYNNIIRRATSPDGLTWPGEGRPCVELQGSDEFSVGRPWLYRREGVRQMWFTIRSHSRPDAIGYAESEDGESWRRLDARAPLERSASGWDSEMLCYPCVVEAGGRTLMFYNGNRHGQTGFGCAVLEP